MAVETRIPAAALKNVTSVRRCVTKVCLRTFSLETVKKSCYRFSDRHFTAVEVDEANTMASVTFSFPSTVTEHEEEALLQRFNQDVLDQDLREQVAEKTEVVRNLILANAFANTDLIDDES